MRSITNFCKVDFQLLPLKVHYFTFFAGLACAMPFRTVFAKQLGLSATNVGIIFLVVPFVKLLTNPFFGFILDYFKRFRLTVGVIMFLVAISHVAMVFIPPKTNPYESKELRNNLRAIVDYIPCKNNSEFAFQQRGELIINTVLENSNGKNQKFACELKCHSKSNSFTNINYSCTKQLSIEMKVSVDIIACKMNTVLTERKLLFAKNGSKVLFYASLKNSTMNENVFHKANSKCLDAPSLKSKSHSKFKTDQVFNLLNESNSLSTWKDKINSSNKHAVDSNIDSFIFTRSNIYIVYSKEDKIIDSNDSNSPCEAEQNCRAKLKCICSKCSFDEEFSAEIVDEDEFMSLQFWSLLALIGASSASLCAVIFSVDTICYEMLLDEKDKYGEQRLWGTIGWGLGALAGGYINQVASAGASEIDYAPSFYLLAILIIIDVIPLFYMKVENIKYSSNICKDVGLLLSQLDVAINVLTVFTVGVLSGLFWNYKFWFMEEIGASQVLLGLSQTVECLVAEVPCFIVSGWIIRKIGYVHCNSLTFLCLGLRYLCFAYMCDPWMSLPVALLHGPTFGLFYASMTMYGKTEAPPGTEATVQALLSMSFEGIGCGTGCILGGIGFDKFGSRNTFLYAGIVSFFLLGCNLILHATVLRSKRNNTHKKEITWN